MVIGQARVAKKKILFEPSPIQIQIIDGILKMCNEEVNTE